MFPLIPPHLDNALWDNLDRLEKLTSDARALVADYRTRLRAGADFAPFQALTMAHWKGKETDMSVTAEAIEHALRMLCPTLTPAPLPALPAPVVDAAPAP